VNWLDKVRHYIIASGSVDIEHLRTDNVRGPMHRIFAE